MSRFKEIQQFVTEANRVTEFSKLQNLLDGTVKALGFDYYALVNQVSTMHRGEPTVWAIDYPEAWICTIRDKGYFVHDPVLFACQRSAAPFTFAQVPHIVKLTALQKEILERAKYGGLGSGFVVPINIPGENMGSCSFGMRVGRDIPRRSFPAALYVGLFAFEAARRVAQRLALKKSHSVQDPKLPRLTKRQLDCVVLAGRGKTDHDVAQHWLPKYLSSDELEQRFPNILTFRHTEIVDELEWEIDTNRGSTVADFLFWKSCMVSFMSMDDDSDGGAVCHDTDEVGNDLIPM